MCVCVCVTGEDAGQRAEAGVGGHQRCFVGVPLVARQHLLQPVVHGQHQHPVTDLLPLGLLADTTEKCVMKMIEKSRKREF